MANNGHAVLFFFELLSAFKMEEQKKISCEPSAKITPTQAVTESKDKGSEFTCERYEPKILCEQPCMCNVTCVGHLNMIENAKLPKMCATCILDTRWQCFKEICRKFDQTFQNLDQRLSELEKRLDGGISMSKQAQRDVCDMRADLERLESHVDDLEDACGPESTVL